MNDPITPEAWRTALEVLKVVAEDSDAAPDLAELERAVQPIARRARRRRRAGPVPDDEAERRSAQSRTDQESNSAHDQAVVRATGLHRIHHGAGPTGGSTGSLARRAHECHICRESYREVDDFYHRLCPACAAENKARRQQTADLSGRMALVTGGRIKIGHATALRLLRNGARVLVTSRFPHETAFRFEKLADFDAWRDRLHIYGLDFLDLRGVLDFADRLTAEWPCLDILINNAAQTVKRPPSFYAPAMAYETGAGGALSPVARALLAAPPSGPSVPEAGLPEIWAGSLDRHGQPPDPRDANSWTFRNHEVPPGELIEVLVINAAAPCLLTAQLKPLMMRSPHPNRFIINATGMDGRFEAPGKSVRHPHVNMSKAALNMLTRTSAADYARDGIFMNSVDTGWVSDEAGYSARQGRVQAGWAPPLDEVDAATRLCAPIFDGLDRPPASGLLFRHYRPDAW